MLRKIAAGTSAAVVAAGLAAAPAAASGLPASPSAVSSGEDPRNPPACGGAAQAEQNGLDPHKTSGFLFGPLADVPYLLSGDRSCFTAASAAADTSPARRKGSAPPPVGAPVPEEPSSPPPDDSGAGAPGPGDSGPPPSAAPPAAPDFTPPAPPPVAPGPTPTSAPAEFGGPSESVLPAVRPPAEAPPRLPLTAVDTRPLTVAGGGSLVAAGLAWIGGARRRRKRPAGPPGD
jgi:hypothetical protein